MYTITILCSSVVRRNRTCVIHPRRHKELLRVFAGGGSLSYLGPKTFVQIICAPFFYCIIVIEKFRGNETRKPTSIYRYLHKECINAHGLTILLSYILYIIYVLQCTYIIYYTILQLC
jgi:hypothetical protein